MSRSLGFIGLIIVVAIGAVIYMKQVQSAAPSAAEGDGSVEDGLAGGGVGVDAEVAEALELEVRGRLDVGQ